MKCIVLYCAAHTVVPTVCTTLSTNLDSFLVKLSTNFRLRVIFM